MLKIMTSMILRSVGVECVHRRDSTMLCRISLVQNLRRTSARKIAACALVNAKLCAAAVSNSSSSIGGPAKNGCRDACGPCGHSEPDGLTIMPRATAPATTSATSLAGSCSARNGALGHAFVSQVDDVPAPVDGLADGVHGGI